MLGSSGLSRNKVGYEYCSYLTHKLIWVLRLDLETKSTDILCFLLFLSADKLIMDTIDIVRCFFRNMFLKNIPLYVVSIFVFFHV